MTPEQILSAVKNKHPQAGWAVYNYNYKYAISRILERGFFFFIFFAVTLTFLYSGLTNSTFFLFAGIFGILSLVSLTTIAIVFMELIHSKNNYIILTEEGVLKSFKGKTDIFPYNVITNVKLTNPYGASTPAIAKRRDQFLDFADKRNNQMFNLAKNRIFGPPENIYDILLSKLPLEQKLNTSQNYLNYFNHLNT
jgi:hypothetical protein